MAKTNPPGGAGALLPPSVTPSPSSKKGWLLPLAILIIAGAGFAVWWSQRETTMTYSKVAEYPHETKGAYTQGLEFYKGFLFEGTGFTNESDVRLVSLKSGEVCYRMGIPSSLFGEGITVLKDRLYQITWRDGVCIVYDMEPLRLSELNPATVSKTDFAEQASSPKRRLKEVKRFTYKGEGWGLTNDGTHLLMSTGSGDGKIHFRDPESFEVLRTLVVTKNGDPVAKLNELEYADGVIYANVFETDNILKIDAASGEVLATIDMSGLLPADTVLERGHVLNGIAIDDAGRIFVTGKNWPKIFEVRFQER